MLDEHYWFCQPHAAEYNRTLELLRRHDRGAGPPRQTEEALVTGGRPTWPFRAGRGSRKAAAACVARLLPRRLRRLRARHQPSAAEKAAYDKRLGRLERSALADLDLDATRRRRDDPRRYTELLKRCHPDANGGDRSAEHKLQRVIKAFRTLRKAKTGLIGARRSRAQLKQPFASRHCHASEPAP